MTTIESLPGADSDFIIMLLGGFGLFCGSALLSIPRASQRLVAFLALHGGMVRRGAVAGTLWPEASRTMPTSTCDKPLHGCTAPPARHWRSASSSLAWPRGSRLTSATRERSPVGCSTRQ
jgi:hypothetical protein